MFKLLLKILFDEFGGTLAITRKTANTLITASGFNTNYDEIEAVINGGIEAGNIAADAVTAVKINVDVVRTSYGLAQHTDGSLYVDLSDTNPGLEVNADGGLRIIAYGLAQRTSNGLDIGRSGDLLLSSASSVPTGWSDVSATYEGKFIRVSATALSEGTGSGSVDSHTLTTAEIPAHTHNISIEGNYGQGSAVQVAAVSGAGAWPGTDVTESAGGGGGHTHTITAYVPAFVSTKLFKHN